MPSSLLCVPHPGVPVPPRPDIPGWAPPVSPSKMPSSPPSALGPGALALPRVTAEASAAPSQPPLGAAAQHSFSLMEPNWQPPDPKTPEATHSHALPPAGQGPAQDRAPGPRGGAGGSQHPECTAAGPGPRPGSPEREAAATPRAPGQGDPKGPWGSVGLLAPGATAQNSCPAGSERAGDLEHLSSTPRCHRHTHRGAGALVGHRRASLLIPARPPPGPSPGDTGPTQREERPSLGPLPHPQSPGGL